MANEVPLAKPTRVLLPDYLSPFQNQKIGEQIGRCEKTLDVLAY